MSDVQLIVLLCIVLAVLVFLSVLLYKRIQKLNLAYEEIDTFCESLKDIVYDRFMESINILIDSISPDFTTTNLQVFVLEAVSNMADEVKELVVHEFKTYIDNDALSDITIKIFNKLGYVDDIVEKYIDEFDIEKLVSSSLETKLGVRISNIEEQNGEIEKKYDNESEFYNSEECNKEDLEKNEDPNYALKTERTEDGEYVIPEEVQEAMKAVNPPKDEEDDSFNPDTMEVIGDDGLTDEERAMGYKIDKNGRKRNKQGRFV